MTAPRHDALLQRKLRSLSAFLDELQSILPAALEEYSAQPTVRRAVERLVQLVMESAVDAGDLLLAQAGRTTGETARDIFEALHSAGIVSDELRRRFAYEYTALRNRIIHNRIIHQYDEFDDAALWRAAQQLVPDGRALLAALIRRADASPPAE